MNSCPCQECPTCGGPSVLFRECTECECLRKNPPADEEDPWDRSSISGDEYDEIWWQHQLDEEERERGRPIILEEKEYCYYCGDEGCFQDCVPCDWCGFTHCYGQCIEEISIDMGYFLELLKQIDGFVRETAQQRQKLLSVLTQGNKRKNLRLQEQKGRWELALFYTGDSYENLES